MIGRIQSGHLAVEGTILAMNLSWDINEEFRGQGIMSQFLELFLNEVKPSQGNCFAVVILKTNTASLRLAHKNGFVVYNEDDENYTQVSKYLMSLYKNNKLGNKISVTVIATGFEHQITDNLDFMPQKSQVTINLGDAVISKMPETNVPSSGLSGIGYEGGNNTGRVIEFGDSNPNKMGQNINGQTDPYVKDNKNVASPNASPFKNREEENRRRESLRAQTQKLNNPKVISDLENQPAYLRRNVTLEDVPSSSDNNFSRYSVNPSNNMEIREGNSFLHDAVD